MVATAAKTAMTTRNRPLLNPLCLLRDQCMSHASMNAVAAVRPTPVKLIVATLNVCGAGPSEPKFGIEAARRLPGSWRSWEATTRYLKCSRNRWLSARPSREFTAVYKPSVSPVSDSQSAWDTTYGARAVNALNSTIACGGHL